MQQIRLMKAAAGGLLLLACAARAVDTTLWFQGFEPGDAWPILSGSNAVSTATGAGDTPAGQRILAGTASWQVNNSTGLLVLADAALPAVTGRLVRVRLSSTSATTGNGADAADYVRVFVALDGAAFSPAPDLQLNGSNSNARWGYWATQTFTTVAGTLASNTAPQAGTSSNNYSTLQVLLPNSATSVAVSVAARNDDTNEFWNVDDVSVVAQVSPPTNVAFLVASQSAGEGAGAVTVTVFKTAGAGTVSAQVALGGTATRDVDYSVDTTNLLLSGAATTATFVVSITNDSLAELPETVVLALANVAGGNLIAPSTMTLTIVSDDLSPAAVSNVWINEVNYDPTGTDTNEFIEVAGRAGVDLSNCTLVLYDGSGGLSYGTTNLSGVLDDEGCGFGAAAFFFTTNSLQNGPDGIALVQGGTVVQFIAYEGLFTAADGAAAGLAATTNIGDFFQSANTPQLSGSATNYAGFAWTTNAPSPGQLNLAQTVAGCSGPLRVTFDPASVTIGETATTVEVQLAKSAAISNVTAQLVVSGTATPGADYVLSTTNISLSGATTAQVVTLTIIDDLALEPAETVTLLLTNLTQAVPGTPASFTLTITANDVLSLVATSATVFAQSASSAAVAGTANNVIVGELTWTNLLTGLSGITPAGTNWLAPAVPLLIGLNPISVTGTNDFGDAIEYIHVITRLDTPRAGPQVIASQGFEPGDAWSIVQGAGQISTNRGPADFPPDQRVLTGTQSWQVAGGSVTLELAQVSLAGFTGRQVNVRLSSTSVTSGNGAENTDLVQCYVALDGAAFPAETNSVISVGGLNNSRWGFWSTNTAAMSVGLQARVLSPQGGLSSNNYSDLYLLIPDSATSAAFKVWARNDGTNEVWNVDAIQLTGYTTGGVNPDADGDLMPDAWELSNFGNTTNTAAGDLDGDGFSNLDEYIAGTHPTNGTAFLRFTAISNAPGVIVIFPGSTGRVYRLDYRDTPAGPGAWTEFTNNIAGTNGLMRVPQADTTNNRSYRVRVQLP